MYGGLFGDLPATNDGEKKETKATSNGNPPGRVACPPPRKTSPSLPLFVPHQAIRRRGPPLTSPAPKRKSQKVPTLTSGSLLQGETLPKSEQVPQQNLESADPYTKSSPSISRFNEGNNKEGNAFASIHEEVSKCTSVNVEGLNISPLESGRFRRAAEEAKEDPYDPLLPNDLLQYWNSQSIAKEKERILKQRDETIKEQEMIRRKLEEERKRLQQEGNVDKIVEHRLQQGLGRGRGGVSNLPAWVVAKQKEDSRY